MEAPFCQHRVTVASDWIDVNHHMNAIHYALVVYDAHYLFCVSMGLGERYVERSGCGTAVLESRIVYEREVREGHELEVRSWLLEVDAKRMHFFHELMNRTTGLRAASSEQTDIHMDLSARKATSISPDLRVVLDAAAQASSAFSSPPRGGLQLGLARG